jgi:hypothetical protein
MAIIPRGFRLSVALAALLAGAMASAADLPLVVVEKEGQPVAVEGLGLAPEVLARIAAGEDKAAGDSLASHILYMQVTAKLGKPPLTKMAGRYEVIGEVLRFTPQFSLKPGLAYEAHFFPPAKSELESPAHYSLTIEVPAPPAGAPAATAVLFPSAEVVPENQLRFYLQFTRPMSRGDVYRHIHLLKEDGQPVDLPFLEIGEELWDAGGTRLTLLVDPGRIKRGLKPREEAGPVFEAGKKYTLVVDKAWRDADGLPMKSGLRRTFAVGPPIERPIDPARWKIQPPPAGSREALRILFPEPLDRALLQRTIQVADEAGKPVAGKVELSDSERVWAFHPHKAWRAGKHALVIDTTLEDLAGNRIGRAFEVDVAGEIDKKINAESIKLPVTIGP